MYNTFSSPGASLFCFSFFFLISRANVLNAHRVTLLETLHTIYDPEVRQAIESYIKHLATVRTRWNERTEAAGRTLAEYEDAGGAQMKEIADRYRYLTDEIEGLKAQVRRLGGEA